jgi:hypothetical protein
MIGAMLPEGLARCADAYLQAAHADAESSTTDEPAQREGSS